MKPSTFLHSLAVAIGLSATPLPALADGAAITLSTVGTFPEAVVRTGDGFLVSSLTTGTLYRVDRSGAVTPFTKAGQNGLVSAIGLRADPQRDRLYACSSDPGLSRLSGTAPPALVAFSLSGGQDAGRWPLPGGGFCNDIAVRADGSVLLTDSFNARILELRPGAEALRVWITDSLFRSEGIGLNGLAETADGALYVVKYDDGRLFRIAPGAAPSAAGAVTEIALPRPLDLPDGLYAHNGTLVVVEGKGRLSQITLPGTGHKQGGLATITTLKDGLSMPTTAEIEGNTAWVLEAQIYHLFDEALKDKTPKPYRLVPVRLSP